MRCLMVVLILVAVVVGVGLLMYRFLAPPPPRAVPVADLGAYADQPSLSPDGRQVAFVSDRDQAGNLDVYVKPLGQGRPIRLSSHPAVEYSPAWSADGRWIAFLRAVRGLGARSEVVVIPARGGTERKLAEVSVRPGPYFLPGPFLCWTPDSAALVVTDQAWPEAPAALHLLSVETGAKRQLTTPPLGAPGDSGPSFSPDGRALAFARSVGFAVGDIYVMPLTAEFTPAGDPQRRTYENRFLAMTAWSPDGKWVLYSSSSGGKYGLYRVKSAGPEAPGPLQGAGEGARFPSVSARARRLVYARWRAAEDVWKLAPGTRPQAVITGEGLDGFADLSPDGQKLAFTSARSKSLEVWVCAIDGKNRAQMTYLQAGFTGFPRWSPDGQYLAFFSNVEGQNEIYVIPAIGGRPRRLTEDPGDDIFPMWSREGRTIYFASNRGKGYQVWKVFLLGADARPVQVTQQGGLAAAESGDGRFLYYSRGAGRLSELWRMSLEGQSTESKVLETVYATGLTAAGRGVYCLSPQPPGYLGASIQFLDTAGGPLRTVATLEGVVGHGLSMARDGSFALVTRAERLAAELVVVDDIR